MRVLLAILGIGFLIAFHELGHYAAARLLGMRVLRYSLGFGPRLLGFRRAGIEYQLAALPFGGFVQIAGMSSMDEAAKDDPRSYLNAPRWKRWLVLGAGPGFNYAAAFFFFFVYFSAWPSPNSEAALELVEVYDGPGRAAGLSRGEFVLKVDGAAVESESAFRASIAASNGAPITLTVLNIAAAHAALTDGEWFRICLARAKQRWRILRKAGAGAVSAAAVDGGWKLGVAPEMRWPSVGVIAAVEASAVACISESLKTLFALKALVQRDPGVDVGGPVAIVAGMKDKIALGARHFVRILATLSVSLGLFNLLPVPGLDGIKMLWLSIEGVVRRNINLKFQEIVNAVGVMLLLILMVGLTVRDGFRLMG